MHIIEADTKRINLKHTFEQAKNPDFLLTLPIHFLMSDGSLVRMFYQPVQKCEQIFFSYQILSF